MNLKKSLLSVLMALVMVLMSSVSVFADGLEESEFTLVLDTPSVWAQKPIYMAQAYQLGNIETYSQYKNQMTAERFIVLHDSLEQKFGVDDEASVDGEFVTRGEVIAELFDIIKLSLDFELDYPALNFFLNNQMISGRSNGYGLDKAATTEEAIVFFVRAYEHIAYAKDMDSVGYFWEVSDGDNTVYLLGSIHVSDGTLFPFSRAIENSFAKSEKIAVEINILAPSMEDVAYYSEVGLYQDGTKLSDVVSKEQFSKILALLTPFGLAQEVIETMKPWYATMVIQSLSVSTAQSAGMGVDMYFLASAIGQKDIIELESFKSQLDMMDSFSIELQLRDLDATLSGIESLVESVDLMLDYWKTGDDGLAALLDINSNDPLDLEYFDKINTSRNIGMTEKIEKMLSEDTENDYFVVVGALHFFNDVGIVKGLENMGYTVKRVK